MTAKKVIGISAAVLLFTAQIVKWGADDHGQNGHFGVPKGTFFFWSLFSMLILVGVILGELMKGVALLACFPLLLSRSGRGALMLMIGFAQFCRNKIVLFLAIPAFIIALLHTILGVRDEKLTIEIVYQAREGTHEPAQTSESSTPVKQASGPPKRELEIEGFDSPAV